MTESDDGENQHQLLVIGRILMQDTVSNMIQVLVWGLYLLLFVYALRIQIRKGLRSRASIVMLTVTVVLFSISTSLLALDLTALLQGYKVMLYENDIRTLINGVDKRYQILGERSPFVEGFFLLTMLIGDSVVIWRAWVISNRHKIIVLPVLFILTSAAFSLLDVVCLTEQAQNVLITSIPPGSRVCTWSEPIAWALSLCTNILSTIIIAWTVWSHKQSIKDLLGEEHRLRSPAERLMVFLVESGFVYCLFWFSQIVLFIPTSRDQGNIWAWEVFAPLGNQISGLYPTIIIVVVNLQYSLHDTYNPQTLDTLTNENESDPSQRDTNHPGGMISLKFRALDTEGQIESSVRYSASEYGHGLCTQRSHRNDSGSYRAV